MDFSSLANPEEEFFKIGYDDGYQHGRIHGLIEGRAVGQDKGFELWEEIGYYRGFANLWKAIIDKTHGPDHRASHHIKLLLESVEKFPLYNPSTPKPSTSPPASDDAHVPPEADLDISKLLTQIRSRYKALCATLGVRPRLRAISNSEQAEAPDDEDSVKPNNGTRQVWNVESAPRSEPLSF